MESKKKDEGKATLIFKVLIKNSDGSVVEKEVEAGKIPNVGEYSIKDVDSFLADFDKYEKAYLKGREQVGKEFTKALFEENVKKKKSRKDD